MAPGLATSRVLGVQVSESATETMAPSPQGAGSDGEPVKRFSALSKANVAYAGGKGGDGRLLAELAELIDIVEVFNARLHRMELNQRAAEWAAAHGKPGGAGSDAHTLAEIGRAHIEVEQHEHSAAGFLRAVRSARVHGTTTPRSAHLASTYAKLHKVIFKAES